MSKILSVVKTCSLFLLFTGMGIGIMSSCEKPSEPYKTTPYTISIPKFFPTRLNIPNDNPLTVEGIELGRHLFYDGRLSGRTHPDSLMTCATCHLQANAFECGINHPKYIQGRTFGLTGNETPHFMMPLINLVWNESGYLWSGYVHSGNNTASNIEDIVWMTINDPNEIAGDTTRTKNLIQSIAGYPEMFEKAFGSQVVTMKNISKAIAQFVRTLISTDSKFDRYLRGEEQLTIQELRGYELFMTEEGADCFHCHGGAANPLFTTNLFYNNGKDVQFNDPLDRYSVTGRNSDKGAYKAPTLRNVEYTAPYMHDGRFKTIEEVIEFYSEGVIASPYVHPLMHHVNDGGIQLTLNEKNDLIAFLKTLSDESFINNPKFKAPAKLN